MERKAQKSYAAIYAATFSRIAQGHYRPTHRIAIAELASSLGVSTTPVREALRQLAGRDLVVERHREGFYLAPLSARAVANLYCAHQNWMNRILDIAPRPGSKNSRQRSLWRLFDSRAAQTGDIAIIAVRRYLDDRLAVLRRHEGMATGDMVERAGAFYQALRERDAATAQAISRDFHERCRARADQIATAFESQG